MLFTVGNMKVCLLLKFLLLLNGNSEVNRSSMILDYDCGSDMVELDSDKTQGKKFQRGAQASIRRIAHCSLMSLRSHEKNQFFSVMRLWDTRIYCVFDGSAHPAILRDRCWKEGTYQSLSTWIYFQFQLLHFGKPFFPLLKVKEYKGFSKFGMV
ncbi:hypothetical protein ERO13_A08G061851v2 [Gossypium hirsutum]|uniref:Uncharacterized protein isoform X1 n=2 Tax=Gossypium TaxID=3633 RepID=A0ABM2YML5_GOSHI|nr:uncharacterized protein LOC107951139 isoform X1 [Gossypium hirsutum]KAG4186734.1 hypothetical protein ERO13_A08G061851v2 [Gossypium hirsutum]